MANRIVPPDREGAHRRGNRTAQWVWQWVWQGVGSPHPTNTVCERPDVPPVPGMVSAICATLGEPTHGNHAEYGSLSAPDAMLDAGRRTSALHIRACS